MNVGKPTKRDLNSLLCSTGTTCESESAALYDPLLQIGAQLQRGRLQRLRPQHVLKPHAHLHVPVKGDADVQAGGGLPRREAELLAALQRSEPVLSAVTQADVKILVEESFHELHPGQFGVDGLFEESRFLRLNPLSQVHAAHTHEDDVLVVEQPRRLGEPLDAGVSSRPAKVQFGAVQLQKIKLLLLRVLGSGLQLFGLLCFLSVCEWVGLFRLLLFRRATARHGEKNTKRALNTWSKPST